MKSSFIIFIIGNIIFLRCLVTYNRLEKNQDQKYRETVSVHDKIELIVWYNNVLYYVDIY